MESPNDIAVHILYAHEKVHKFEQKVKDIRLKIRQHTEKLKMINDFVLTTILQRLSSSSYANFLFLTKYFLQYFVL